MTRTTNPNPQAITSFSAWNYLLTWSFDEIIEKLIQPLQNWFRLGNSRLWNIQSTSHQKNHVLFEIVQNQLPIQPAPASIKNSSKSPSFRWFKAIRNTAAPSCWTFTKMDRATTRSFLPWKTKRAKQNMAKKRKKVWNRICWTWFWTIFCESKNVWLCLGYWPFAEKKKHVLWWKPTANGSSLPPSPARSSWYSPDDWDMLPRRPPNAKLVWSTRVRLIGKMVKLAALNCWKSTWKLRIWLLIVEKLASQNYEK